MNILFVTSPFSGHYHPGVPIARALASQGHRVAYVAAPSLGGLFTRLGFDVFPGGMEPDHPEVASAQREGGRASPEDRREVNARRLFAGVFARNLAPTLLEVATSWNADVLISDRTEIACPVVGERLNIPNVVICGGHRRPEAERPLRLAERGPELGEVRASVGLAPVVDSSRPSSHLDLVLGAPSYQDPASRPGARTLFVRPEMFDQSGGEHLPGWVEELPKRPTVYATLGTVFNRASGPLEAVVEAAAEIDINLVVTTGRDRSPESLGMLPSNVRAERYIPQSLLLRRCDAVIAHAGYGTVMGALLNGLPMVLLPLGADQPVNARACQRLGAALVISPQKISPIAIRSALLSVLEDDTYRQSSKRHQIELEALPSASSAVEAIADLVSES